MSVQAGHCTLCGAALWRSVTHPRTGAAVPLWPRPDATFARVRTGDRIVPGLGYCGAHTPGLGTPGPDGMRVAGTGEALAPGRVVAIELAPLRYTLPYESGYRTHLAAWLEDELGLPEHARAALLELWETDRTDAEALHA